MITTTENANIPLVGRGRQLFQTAKPILSGVTKLISLLPTSLCELTFTLCRNLPTKAGIAVRYVLLSRLARACGDNVAIFEGVYLFHIAKMQIGNNVSIHQMCYLDAFGGIDIGSDVAIAHGSTIMTTEHNYQDVAAAIRDAGCSASPVRISDDVWIGAGVKVLAGVTIGSHSVVGAGAVVTRDVESNSVAAGVPARRLKVIRKEVL